MSEPNPSLSRRNALLIAFLMVFLVASPEAAAAAPCPPLSYRVTYSLPLCVVTLTEGSLRAPLTHLWWQNPSNDTWEQASQHVGRMATSSELITYQDNDQDTNASASDTVQIWARDCVGNLPVHFGTNATDTSGGTQTLLLGDGIQVTCGSPSPDVVTPILIAFAAVLVALPLAALLIQTRHRRH